MTSSTRLGAQTDWRRLVLRCLLIGLGIALALAPTVAGGTPSLGQADTAPAAMTGSGPAGMIAGVTRLPAPPPGAPPPDSWPGGDCAALPGGLVAL